MKMVSLHVVSNFIAFLLNLTSRFCTNNDLYYTVDGKPMIVVWNADKLYARDSEKLIIRSVKEYVKNDKRRQWQWA